MSLLSRALCACLGAAFALGTPKASAQFDVAGADRFSDNSPVAIAAKRLQPFFLKNLPIVRDPSATYPTVPALPNGAPFSPSRDAAAQNALRLQLVRDLRGSSNGAVVLGGGDYAVPVRIYCADVLHRGQSSQAYVLGPLRGTRSLVITEVFANAAAAAPKFDTLQPLSWSLQEGMKYDELPRPQRLLFDALLPGRREQIAQSFPDLMKSRWTVASRGIDGVPPFEDALAQMGQMGRFIANADSARRRLADSALTFDALRNALMQDSGDAGPGVDGPWSVAAPNVYERLHVRGPLGSVGILDIHVDGAARAIVPLTSNIAYAQQCTECQPLIMHPIKGAP